MGGFVSQIMSSDISESNCASVDELNKRIKEDNVYIIDVRNPSEMGADGSECFNIKKRINIPFPEFEKDINMDDKDYVAKYGLSKPSKDGSEVILHCGLGGRSARALKIMLDMGYSNAKHLPGGYKKWKEETSKSGQ